MVRSAPTGTTMIILALEASTVRCGAALLRDGATLAETEWEDTATDHQRLFRVLPDLCAAAGVRLADVACFAVDSGPGRFPGLRTAMAAARGMALPDQRPVIGIDSGSAIAWQIWRGGAAGPVAVAGDARRNRLWIARFEDGAKGSRIQTSYTSVPIEDAASILMPGDRLASPDWMTVAGVLETIAGKASAMVIREPCRPTARTIGQLASLKVAAGESSPSAILYLHPPV